MKLKQKIYFIVGGLIIFSAAFLIFVAYPLFSDIKKNSQEFLEAKNEIASFDAEVENFSLVKKQYQEYQENFDKIDGLLVNKEVPIDFIRFLEKLADESDVSVEIFAGSTNDNEFWPAIYFQISTESSFLNLSRFLEKLENANYLIDVQNLSISATGDKNKNNEVAASFLIKVFAK